MIRSLQLPLAFVLTILLAACAGPVPKIDTQPSALAEIKTIAVIRPPEPKTYTLLNFGHPGIAFGAIGGLVAAGDMQSKQERLSATYKEQGAAFSSDLASAISAELSKAGYVARVEDGPWQQEDGKYKIEFAAIKSDADAVLVVSPTMIGFVSEYGFSNYLPTITAVVSLVGRDRSTSVYRGFHSSGWKPKAEGWKSSEANVSFANFDSLMADTKASAGSITGAAGAIASTVAADLKR